MELPDYMGLAYYDPDIEDPEPDLPAPRDSRPEHVQYRDEGCDVAPECLSCPLPRCRYDDPGWLKRQTRMERDRRVLAAKREEGLGPGALAARFGLSRRTVHRILKEARS